MKIYSQHVQSYIYAAISVFRDLEGFSDAQTHYWLLVVKKNSVRFMFYDAY